MSARDPIANLWVSWFFLPEKAAIARCFGATWGQKDEGQKDTILGGGPNSARSVASPRDEGGDTQSAAPPDVWVSGNGATGGADGLVPRDRTPLAPVRRSIRIVVDRTAGLEEPLPSVSHQPGTLAVRFAVDTVTGLLCEDETRHV